MMRPRKLTWTSKTSSFFFSSINSTSLCTNPVVFFFFDTSFPLFWTGSFKPELSQTDSSKILRKIRRKSWKPSQKIELSCFLFLGKDWGITRLGLYIRLNLSRIRSFDTWKKNRSSCFRFLAFTLASFSRFLFSASCFLFSTSSRLKTQAPWPSYWRQVHWAHCYFLYISCQKFRISTV